MLVERSAANQGILHVAISTVGQIDATIQKYLAVGLVLINVHDAVNPGLLGYASGINEFEGWRGFHGDSGKD